MFHILCLDGGLTTELTALESWLEKNTTQVKGVISVVCKSLRSKSWAMFSSFQNHWNKDCHFDSSFDVWPKIWAASLLLSRSTYIRVQHFKVVARWYLTPARIHKFSSPLSV